MTSRISPRMAAGAALLAFGGALALTALARRRPRRAASLPAAAGAAASDAVGPSPSPAARSASEPPIRGDILSLERLEQYARDSTAQQRVDQRPGDIRGLQQAIATAEARIESACAAFAADVAADRPITPAAEWLLDNLTVVLDQIREIRVDLPGGYYRELPKLTAGPLAGLPRVYALALDLITHTDSRIDVAHLIRFILAYQSVTALSIGELWAVPIMLRVGLVENLGRLAALTLETRELRREADEWVDLLLAIEEAAPSATSESGATTPPAERPHALPILAALAARYPDLPIPLAVQMLHRLRGYRVDEDGVLASAWLESYLADRFESAEALLNAEHQRQAANQATVGNVITTMRTLTAVQWADWFEQVSLVEQVLRQDPAGVYARGTFATRDSYRHVIETMARRSGRPEVEVAWHLVGFAGRPGAGAPRETHIGYYLVGPGRAAFEHQLGYQPPPLARLQRAILRSPTPVYLGAVGGLTVGLVGAALAAAGLSPRRPSGVAAAALLLLPASDVAQGLVNWAITRLLRPRVLPRLDLSAGIPDDLRTIVVVPMLLLTPDSVAGQLDRLEVISLANDDPNLHFALLSDFADAVAATMPEDDALLQAAVDHVKELNRRHGADRFFFFHRRRLWNPAQNCYMGWERKRGKLDEFNRMLAGATNTTFDAQVGDLSVLPNLRYVITLDADTQLPRDVARTLIGTLAHPLNQAVIDPVRRLVVEGYGILQPRVGIDTHSATRSRFAALFAGNVGIDPYTTAVSDVYMDLFGEGIFAGKGIYDPAVLNTVLADRFPDNALLSHDLIEGLFARAGLLSDVELLDSYPSTYVAYAARLHRWMRGDWQISPWLLPTVPRGDGGSARNPLSLIDRYKILDNLRRSLMAPAMVALLVGGWLALPRRRGLWTTLALGPLGLPVLLGLAESLLSLPRAEDRRIALRADADDLRLRLARFAVNTALLADQSLLSLDAIIRTLVRLLVTHRLLLEWETAAQTEARVRESYAFLLRRLAPVLPVAAGLAVAARRRLPRVWPIATPVVASWAAGPGLATWLDGQTHAPPPALGDEQRRGLRRLARKTWDYFATFVTEEGHCLAPDNYQEDPRPVVAHRASPTNIGLQLLADITAHDLGYLGLLDMTARTEAVFATLERLPHYRGHLLNWYDTQTLQPLPPAYVSTVDSGNLAGYLLALRQAYAEVADRPLLTPDVGDGLEDTLALLQADLPPAAVTTRAEAEALRQRLIARPTTTAEYVALLRDVARRAARLPNNGAMGRWAARLQTQAASLLRDAEELLAVDAVAALAALDPAGAAARVWRAPPPTLANLPALLDELLAESDALPTAAARSPLAQARDRVGELLARHAALGHSTAEWVRAMDFSFLYDDRRELFVIGYNVAEGRFDNSYYDLLASEARLASFIAIGKGEVPQEHWFHLGRPLTAVDSSAALLSWSGTMFEYLMPLLVMRNYPGTLLDETYQAVVQRQIEYGRERRVPWGISESAFTARDFSLNYQYRAFGVPGLGLKRGLGSDLVIAPYATLLALLVQPDAALENIQALARAGLEGAYGLYEAIDYTRSRLPPGKTSVVVRSFMVHHQAMSLLALANTLRGGEWQRRFHAVPLVQATELLLQERFPRYAPRQEVPYVTAEARTSETPTAAASRWFTTPHTRVPAAHRLSNGTYSVVISNGGGGFSRYRDLAVTRWREDTTLDAWGSFCYLRDIHSGATWSTAYQPTCHALDGYRATYGLDKVEFHQRFAGIDTRMEITVSPEDDAEVRRITLTNQTSELREIEVTSYSEIVLAPQGADEAHPAFSNLFVETDVVPDSDALLATRRPRSADEARHWAVHVVAVDGHTVGATQHETDRARFVGRGRTAAAPIALGEALSSTTGAVLDPIFSLRRTVRIVPGGSVQVSFATAVADSREQALILADKYHDYPAVTRAFEMAWTQSRVELRHLNLNPDAAQNYQRLASALVYTDPRLRARPTVLARNSEGQPRLWGYGVSGDLPIVLARITSSQELSLVRELLQAHEYWRLKGLAADLVILNEHASGYLQGIQDQILGLCQAGSAGAWLNRPGGVFVLRADAMSAEDRLLFQTVARAVFHGQNGELGQQLAAQEWPPANRTAPPSEWPAPSVASPTVGPPSPASGQFSPDSDEYVIDLQAGQATPAPWINVVANENFGFIVSERGAGFTWSENSRENRLTPWSNDPVVDPSGEAIYLRDEDSGVLWSPTPQPVGEGAYRVRHGFGYSVFAHERDGIESELSLSVPRADSVKLMRLRLRNTSDHPRRLSATFFAEWTLGVFRDHMAPFIITAHDAATGALLAHNPYNNEFSARVAFAATDAPVDDWTCDRRDFLGRHGDRRWPAALRRRAAAPGRVGAGLDPCAALRRRLDLAPGETREIVFLLGEGADQGDAQRLVTQYRDPAAAAAAEDEARAWWRGLLRTVQVETPQPDLNALLNGWLLYQTLACRVWARSAFYQSGGAFGFRDQLQDVMALTLAAPDITRAHILRAAGRQFVEGDVQHWWHPPTGRGIRTRFSDDYLWLAFVTHVYLTSTGDASILDETLPFLEGRPLADGEAEYYDTPTVSAERGSLYEHVVRALEHGLRFGAHGLPLMGAGDWNDGMNRVGDGGKGESVWVGWFLYLNLAQWAEQAAARGDDERAQRYRAEAERLRDALDTHAWDGAWYLRAFYDDGTPLGSAQNVECRIDSLTQSWAVMSGAAPLDRARQALAAVDEYLVDRDNHLIKLFTPPFDHTDHDPGYIKGYVPGVRENGGQYTHAALWVVWAYAQLGDAERAAELFAFLDPVAHSRDDEALYQVEPYVVVADIYTATNHVGRGGWTWYTGSAGWMYRLGIEMLLGLRKEGDSVTITPCIPAAWPGYRVVYRYGTAVYEINVTAGTGSASPRVVVDGSVLHEGRVNLIDDGSTHKVEVHWHRTSAGPGGAEQG